MIDFADERPVRAGLVFRSLAARCHELPLAQALASGFEALDAMEVDLAPAAVVMAILHLSVVSRGSPDHTPIFRPERARGLFELATVLDRPAEVPSASALAAWRSAAALLRLKNQDRKSTRLNSSHVRLSRMPSSA